MTAFTHRIILTTSEGSAYNAARGAMAQVTGETADATATWRESTDGTQDDDGAYVVTHRVADTLARASTVAALPTLQSQIGGTYHILVDGRGTPSERVLMTRAEALEAAGLWLLSTDVTTNDEGSEVESQTLER